MRLNDWQLHDWVAKDNRLKAGIVVPQEYPEFAAREIDERAQNEAFRQVIISPRSSEPLGRRKYWPIYEAIVRSNLVLGLHPAGLSGGHATSGTGWGTYYMQEHYGFGTRHDRQRRQPDCRRRVRALPGAESSDDRNRHSPGRPSLGWRMDKQWERNRKETPHLKRPPSEYLREHFWFCTQPMEEPEDPAHLQDILGWIGWDKMMYSSDYPHWDYDDPRVALNFRMTPPQRAGILRDNAKALYRLP